MNAICAWCGTDLGPREAHEKDADTITHGICGPCFDNVLSASSQTLEQLLDRLDAPVLVVGPNGQVQFGNRHAAALLNKPPHRIRNVLGGEAIECVHAREPGGCGGTEHCKACAIRRSVMETFETGESCLHKSADYRVHTSGGVVPKRLEVSTEKYGGVVLLRIDELAEAECP